MRTAPTDATREVRWPGKRIAWRITSASTGGKRGLMVASLCYNDTFVKIDAALLFTERLLYVDWVDERALS
jgi:hypothetical protein